MKQKLLSLLFMAFVPITMMAYDYAFNYGDNEYPRFVYFNLNTDGTATVTYLDTEYNSYSGDVAIPKYLEISGQRYTVTSIGKSAFRECTELTSVTIPNSVTSIGEYAFFVCPDLTSVTMPNSVTSIGNYAFSQCGLNSISIPGSVKTIGKEAFAYCENLASVSFAEGLKTIGEDAFSDCYKLTSINIPSTVESIGEGAFACVYFDEVPRFLSTITVASNNSVYDSRNNCNAIIETAKDKLICGCKNTVLPETVKIIDSYAFSCCNIQSIFLSDVVNSIGEGAFKSTKLQTFLINP